ncbi:low affinity iron permease family protein [Bradyrhizobium lablabi]|uniref:low affinity iron permease family protein n=1 Tax=Bradyrhizobium lablabi TaxID=722472 RepID=UPI00289FEBAE|nr:low affinity iron permease family protein [Bradyrhizobium lablabi]
MAAIGLYAVLWLSLDAATLNWHGVATLATLLMTLFIQRSEHRDTQAIHAKLDELLRVDRQARDDLASIDEREPEEVESFRDHQSDTPRHTA